MEILADNILTENILKPNDILKISFGKTIKICYDDYNEFKVKRQLI